MSISKLSKLQLKCFGPARCPGIWPHQTSPFPPATPRNVARWGDLLWPPWRREIQTNQTSWLLHPWPFTSFQRMIMGQHVSVQCQIFWDAVRSCKIWKWMWLVTFLFWGNPWWCPPVLADLSGSFRCSPAPTSGSGARRPWRPRKNSRPRGLRPCGGAWSRSWTSPCTVCASYVNMSYQSYPQSPHPCYISIVAFAHSYAIL